MNDADGILSQKLLARRWRLSPRTIERWRHQGHGPVYVRLGGRIGYRIEDVQAYEASRLVDPATKAAERRTA